MELTSLSENIVTKSFVRNGESLELRINIDAFTPDFFRKVGERFKEKMAAGKEPVVRKSVMQYPDGPGLGLEINEDWLRQHTAKGETWWG